MEVLQNRLDSFSKQKRGKSLKWPHPKTWLATPDTLAEAGFYFDPSTDDPDNATCFMCNKQVTEWAEDDDPFDIHWQKCAKVCAWANLRCGLRRDADSDGSYVFPDKARLPTSKAMEKARLETFAGQGWKWKHDKNKKHGATAKKMAQAGFVFTPTEADDDTGTCLYCEIALGNWDEDDDPMQHHRERDKPSRPCPFLALTSDSGAPKQSKTTKRSTKAKPLTHTDVFMPTKTFDGSDDDHDSAEPFRGTAAKTPRKTASTSTAKTPRTMTRSLSRANLRDINVPLYEEEAITPPPKKRGRSKSISRPKVVENDQGEASPPPPARQRRPTTAARSRSKSVSRPAALDAASLFDDDDDDEPQGSSKHHVEPPEPQVPRKTSRSQSKAREVETDDGHVAEEPVVRKPSRSKSKARQVEAELDGAEEEVPRKPSRTKAKPKGSDVEKESGSKRPPSRSQSKPQPPPDDPSSDDGWFVAPIPPPPPTRSRTKSVSRAKGKNQGADVDEPLVISRKEQKARQRDTAAASDEPETRKPASRARHDPPDEEADPVARKPSRAKPKASVTEGPEVKKPPSRTKAKPPPPPANDEAGEEEDEIRMEQYLPPPSSQRPTAVKSRSKPPSKVAEIVEESKAPRARKPSSRSASKPVVPKFELALPSAEAVEEEEPPPRAEPVVPPPTRTRTASTRSTASATTKAKAKSKRDPTPSHDLLDLDMQGPDEPEEPEPVTVPRQVSRAKLAPLAAGPSSSEATDVQSSTSRKPASKASAPTHKPRSRSQSQPRPPKAKKEAQYHDDQERRSSGGESDADLPVVEIISTDDDEPEGTKVVPKPKGKGKSKEKKPVDRAEEEQLPLAHDHPGQKMDEGDDDVEMAEVEESMRMSPQGGQSLPATPPRAHAPAASTDEEPSAWDRPQASPEGFAFTPPLATDPFLNLDSLTEAEQDMTVEEWIRYQMSIEYERFKRDGERQLGMFDVRAEEVRRAIETL